VKTAPAEALPTVVAHPNSNLFRMANTPRNLGPHGWRNLKHSPTILAFHLNNIGRNNVSVRSTAKRTLDRFSFAQVSSTHFSIVLLELDFSEPKTYAYAIACYE